MIVTAKNGKRRTFYGVDFLLLANGPQSMLTKMLYKQSDNVPYHKHSNEQSGYILSGRYRIKFGEYDRIVEPGDTYCIPGNVEHCIEIIEPGEVLDFFTPPREDYL